MAAHAENSLPDAVRQAPAVAAALQRAEAAHIRAGAAGRWADPEVEGMLANKETPEDTMPMWGASLKQPLPKWGERGADRAQAQAALRMARAEAELMAGEVAAEVAEALAEREAALQLAELLTRQLERTTRAQAAVAARLSAGQGRLTDQLALQSRETELRLAIERETIRIENADNEVRQPLGLSPTEPLPAFEAPPVEQIRADVTPGIRLLEAQKDESRAMAWMARASARPMTAISLNFEREETEPGDEDTLGVALMTELPWNSRRYARADEKAALAELSGRAEEEEALRLRIGADVARAARMARLASQTRAAVEATRQRVEREYEAQVNAAGTGGMQESSTVLMLLELLDRSTELEMQLIEAEAEARMAQAALWRYQPILTGDEP